MNQIIFCGSSFGRRSGVYIFKVPQGNNEWISKWRKDTESENLKKYLPLWNTLFWISTYRSMYKVKAFLFLEKSQFRETVKLKVFQKNALQWLMGQHTFLFLKNIKNSAWIYSNKLLLQSLATLFFYWFSPIS